MLSASLKGYREEASAIMTRAHVGIPLIEKTRNANTKAELIMAVNAARKSLVGTKFAPDLDIVIASIKADLSR